MVLVKSKTLDFLTFIVRLFFSDDHEKRERSGFILELVKNIIPTYDCGNFFCSFL